MEGGEYIEIAGGSITEIIEGDYNIYAGQHIVNTAGKSVIENGEKGVRFGEPEDPPPVEIAAKCIVHVRPKSNWKGEDYGFDWMRIDDTGNRFGDKDGYKEIVGFYDKYPSSDPSATFTKSATNYNSLKLEYSPVYTIPWKLNKDNKVEQYFTSSLSVYPYVEVPISLHVLIHKTKKIDKTDTAPEIPAKLLVPKSLRLAYEHEFFEVKFAGIVGKEIEDAEEVPNPKIHYVNITIKENEDYKLDDSLIIKCIKPLPVQKQLRILADKIACGYLNVRANDNVLCKKLKILCVAVIENTDGSRRGKTGVIKGKLEITKYLKQSLIEVLYSDIELDVRLTNTIPPQPNTILQQTMPNSNLLGTDADGNSALNVIGQVKTDQGFPQLNEYLKDELDARFKNVDGTPKYNDFVKIFYIKENGFTVTANGTKLNVGGIGRKASNDFLAFSNISDVDLAHEAFHAIGLQHSFGTGQADISNYAFEYKKTENIMDYSHLDSHDKYSTWKWQWNILSSNTLLTDTL